MKRLITEIGAALLVAALAGLSLAEEGAGGITGVLRDPSGAVIPGASVSVSGPPGLVKSVITGVDGRYSITGLAAGSYTLRASAQGFGLFEAAGLAIGAGQPLTLDISLVVTMTKQEVTVQDTARVEVDPSSNAGALVLKGADLDALSDDPDDLEADLQALAGPSAGPNGGQIFIDGFSGGRLPPKSSIREIRINQNPFSAEYDRLGFGRIEVFTKPGSDKFRGQAFLNFGDSIFNSRNPFALNKPPYQQKMFGGNLSGPLGKKASFFIDLERRDMQETAVINALAPDSSLNISPFQATVFNPNVRTVVSPRIDYQLSPRNTLVGRYMWTGTSQTNEGLDTFSLPSRASNGTGGDHTAQLTETAVISPSLINEVRAQFVHRNNDLWSVSSEPAIQVLQALSAGGATTGTSTTTENHWEVSNTTSLTHKRHLLKFGGRVRGVEQSDRSTQGYNGTFTFASLDAYRITLVGLRDGLSGTQIRALGGGASQFLLTAGNPLASVGQTDAGLFIQDDWRLRSNFTLSAGLRYETQNNISDQASLAPRVGIAWGLGRPGKPVAVIRAGFGLFYDRVGEDLVLQARRLDGLHQQQYVVASPDFFPTLPPVESLAANLRGQAIRVLDTNLKAPYITQSALSIERQLPKNIMLSLTYTDSRGFHTLRSRNINAPLPGTYDAAIPGSGVRPYDGGNIYLYESSGVFRQRQVIANVNARINSAFSLFGFYVWGHAKSNTDGAGSFPFNQYDLSSEYGRAGFDVRHRAFLGGSLTGPLNLRLSPFVVIHSGSPFNITVGRDLNGDSLFNDRPSFATDLSRPSVVRTAYGDFDTAPLPSQIIVPRNWAEGPGTFSVNLRLSRTFGFGEKTSAPPAAGSERHGPPLGGPGGHGPGGPGGGHGGPGGGHGGPGGGPGGIFRDSAAASSRYSVTFSVSARNLLNTVNLAPPIGNLNSPLFGQSNALATFGPRGGSATANRVIELQLRFSF